MYLSISSWSEPALATLARVGAPGVAVGVTETVGLAVLLLDPQLTSSSATIAVAATTVID
jgi:hypothetical protein